MDVHYQELYDQMAGFIGDFQDTEKQIIGIMKEANLLVVPKGNLETGQVRVLEEEKKDPQKVNQQTDNIPKLKNDEIRSNSPFKSDETLPCFKIGIEQFKMLDKIFKPKFMENKNDSVSLFEESKLSEIQENVLEIS